MKNWLSVHLFTHLGVNSEQREQWGYVAEFSQEKEERGSGHFKNLSEIEGLHEA